MQEGGALSAFEFGTLWATIEGVEWDVNEHMLTTLNIGAEGETWLEPFPDQLVRGLAQLDDARVSQVATCVGQDRRA